MGLVDKVNVLDNFLSERHLEKEFTKEKYDYNGIEYDGKSINTESYIKEQKLNDSTGGLIEVEVTFKEYQIGEFNEALRELKKGFVEEYMTSYKPLVEKLAFGNSLKEHLQTKLETFRNSKPGRWYAGLLSSFINELTIEFLEHDDSNEEKHNSFKYTDKLFHRATLSKLFNGLIENRLIGTETKELDFKNIFQNKVVHNRIRWIGSTSELKYFIELINRKDLGFEDKKSYKWRIGVKCFVKVSTSSLKTITYKDLRTYKITDNTRPKLDDILVDKILKV